LFAGPIFSREALTSPRQLKHYLIRSGYAAALFILMYTAGQATFGWQEVRNIGDIARFGGLIFQVFSLVQLSLVAFFALLFTAGNIAQEKDRKTLVLLLMTDLRSRELVLGKLLASLLLVAVLIVASMPVFALVHLLGGVSLEQIGWSLAICAATALAAGSWGGLVAFWREKTFQTLAISVLGLVLFLGLAEAVIGVAGSESVAGQWAALLNPYRAIAVVLDPLGQHADPLGRMIGVDAAAVPVLGSVLVLLLLAAGLNAAAITRLREWNPSKFVWIPKETDDAAEKTAPARAIWSNPVIWREIRTKAYGTKVFLIKVAYIAMALFAVLYLVRSPSDGGLVLGMISPLGFAFVALGLIALMLVNTQAVTSLTTERDAKTLELLLVTDITAKEFIYGKLGGVLYNTKEIILVPLALIGYYVTQGHVTWENCAYLVIGFLLLVAFSAMLGLHSGLSFENSRSAIANSLGTMFFLFIGIFICMMLIVEARSSFALQLPSFLVFIIGGSIGLGASLMHKNPSPALTLSAAILPFLTFYAITGFLLNETLGVLLALAGAYGFTTIAMLVPSVSEFDVALGRTTLDKG
jgi:ABC-type transport system involved in multi-copper enzyme maturation permease subunit